MAELGPVAARLRSLATSTPAATPLRRARLEWQARHGGYPDWSGLLQDSAQWAAAKQAAAYGPRVLVATNVGLHFAANTFDSTLAVALTLRGAAVEVLLCDRALPACMACQSDWFPNRRRFVQHGPQKDLCDMCFRHGSDLYDALGLPVRTLGELLHPGEAEHVQRELATLSASDLGELTDSGRALGEQARAGALRFVARGSLDGEPYADEIARRYAAGTVLSARAAERLLAERSYEAVVLHHGIYVPQGPVAQVARETGVRVVTWTPGYRSGTFVFSHEDTYHQTLMTEPTEVWEHRALDDTEEQQLTDYLESRRTGSQDWISFTGTKPEQDLRRVEEAVGCDLAKPTIGLLTNVVWDAQLHYPANVFPDMLAWLSETVEWFARRPDLQLLVRVHPAEVRGMLASRQKVEDELARRFPQLPPNVFVVPPDSTVSTYTAMEACDTALIYATKTGVELAARGIPVIVAGEAWVRGKGITCDPATREEYFALLDELPQRRRLDKEHVERARRYAYHFFFRRMIAVDSMAPSSGPAPFAVEIDRLGALGAGRDAGLDVICAGILAGSPFTAARDVSPRRP
jgi:hypothetical protein